MTEIGCLTRIAGLLGPVPCVAAHLFLSFSVGVSLISTLQFGAPPVVIFNDASVFLSPLHWNLNPIQNVQSISSIHVYAVQSLAGFSIVVVADDNTSSKRCHAEPTKQLLKVNIQRGICNSGRQRPGQRPKDIQREKDSGTQDESENQRE
ncbi:hypothetical protein Q8A73_000824 [Channa argus]|nr:hypothetical protein Q8A73_000824 [Channa argus]